MQKWRNWQTRTVQVRVVEIPCGFDSHLLHWQCEAESSFELSVFLMSKLLQMQQTFAGGDGKIGIVNFGKIVYTVGCDRFCGR